MLLIVAGELLVRCLVPKEFYLPISNIYRAVDNEIGYTYKPNFIGTAFGVPLRTNSLGFRGPEWSMEKEKNMVRIVLIGDSHAFGYGVPFAETVGEQLALLLNQERQKKFEVLNFGVSGYNSRQELAVWREFAKKFNPDIVVLMPCSNDDEEALVADRDGFLRRANNTEVKDKSIVALEEGVLSWLSKKSRLVFYLLFLNKQYELSQVMPKSPGTPAVRGREQGWWMGVFAAGPIPEQLRQRVYAPLREIIDEAKKREMSVVIANYNALLDYRRLFAQLADAEEVPTVELLALFPEVNSWAELISQFGLGWNNHLNAVAHRRWAHAIYRVLQDQR